VGDGWPRSCAESRLGRLARVPLSGVGTAMASCLSLRETGVASRAVRVRWIAGGPALLLAGRTARAPAGLLLCLALRRRAVGVAGTPLREISSSGA
jgi:hypothetical protein